MGEEGRGVRGRGGDAGTCRILERARPWVGALGRLVGAVRKSVNVIGALHGIANAPVRGRARRDPG